MSGLVKNLFILFASGFCVAFGSKLGEYLTRELTAAKQAQSGGPTGSPARELCPKCGQSLLRFAQTLYCSRCGHREP